MRVLRILVADDHEVVRRGLRELLDAHEGWTVIAEASNGNEAIEKAMATRPDVALLDLRMPELNGLDATRRIRQSLPQTEVLLLTVDDCDGMVREAVSCGAQGYVVKADAASVLVAAVESAARHRFYLSPALADSNAQHSHPENGTPQTPRLTSREREILQLLAEGNSNKETALRLNIAVKTVETHRVNIMRKTGAHVTADLVRYAIRNGLVAQ